jgi:mRNA interferase MazF
VTRAHAPQRGDILRLNFDPQVGHEQSGFRPAVVISNTTYNEHSSTIVVCPVTSNIGDWPFKVALPPGAPVKGAVLVDQIKVVDWRARRVRTAGVCPNEVMEQIDIKLDVLFRGVSRTAAEV